MKLFMFKSGVDKLNEEIKLLKKENKELRGNVRNLLWNICNQREKAYGSVVSLVNIAYNAIDEDHKMIIIDKVKKSLGVWN